MINAKYLGLTANQLAETASELEDENARLRKLAVLQSVIFKHMSTCPTTDCRVCSVNDECAESVHLEGLLGIDDKETNWLVQWRSEDATDVRAENAKLRELVKHVISRYNDINREYWGNQEPLPCDLCNMERQCSEVPQHDRCLFYEYLRELGLEVDDA